MGKITGNGTAVRGLGGAAGYGEVMLPRGDDTVARVDVSAVFEAGFKLGGGQYAADRLFVSTDGLVSLGTGFSGVATTAAAIQSPFFAIFNADVDTRLDGEGAESGAVWLDIDSAADCVTITWENVGFYRRNATQTDTFQMQLFDRGNGAFDVVYRYQSITWTSGDLQGGWGGLGGIAALIGLGHGGAASLLPASGVEGAQLDLPDTLGNTGVMGLWVFSFGPATVITGTPGADRLTGTADNDTLRGLGGADVLLGSAGADVMDGGAGIDRVDYSRAPSAVRVDLARPSANLGQATGDSFQVIEQFSGSAFNDSLLGGTAGDHFSGGDGADLLDGRSGADSLFGGAGADRLLGGGSHDLLESGSGPDDLRGGGGRDTLDGGLSSDRLTGGPGADAFRHAGTSGQGSDWVMDFNSAAHDHLVFGRTGAVRSDFSVTFATVAGAGAPDELEALITYLPLNRVVWILVDGADEPSITVHSSMNSFDLL